MIVSNPYNARRCSDASHNGARYVSELYQQMKDHSALAAAPARPLSNSTNNLTSLCVDISPSSSNFFEVLYIGKIKVWHKKVPESFIDDALLKFKQHDLDKNRKKLARLKSEMDLRRGSVDSTCSNSSTEGPIIPKLQRSLSLLSNLSIKSPDVDRKVPTSIDRITESDDAEGDEDKAAEEDQKNDELDLAELEKQLKTGPQVEDHNRTMVLQVDRTDLRLISPDRKVILLHKQHKDISTCIQGVKNSEHFGFITRENNSLNTYIGFVFKCESSSVASETVAAITQAYNNVDLKINRPAIASCDHCPMVWYHKLCCEVENLTDRKTQAAIFRKIDFLEEEEQSLILAKFRGAETDSLKEQNEFLMMLLRAHCEMKQGRHVHDTAENRSEFLNQYLGGSTIFMKAKRSLTSSFDHLLKRRASKDDFSPILKDLTLPVHTISRENSPINADVSDSEGPRSRSSTMSSQDFRESCSVNKKSSSPEHDKTLKSPMMDIFFKVGSSPKNGTELSHKYDAGSWRQAIFKRVITPSKARTDGRKLTKEELRGLWKKSIHQAILLVRMEKENARIRAKQEESAVKRIKLEYEELRCKHDETVEVWESLASKDSKVKCDNKMLVNAIRQGVPRGKRGEVWQVLAEEYSAKMPPVDPTRYSNYNVPYETLLKQLTSHQHAILIDLGRTFPAHSYYSSPLGPGQLALFNLLKAYSLLDEDVGYCQGLSFVAGVLLLHMEESQAFYLLRHLMYRRDLRKQYLPDMVGLQVKLYQLSRLLHDQLPELYAHFDLHEVAPTLYAAPWLLTIFASQFPLGFVTRIFDLIFLEDTDVIFRVILSLLTIHKEHILACDSFEDIMNYLKIKLPAIDTDMLEKIMKEVYTTDISKQLIEYHVEYFVLQEEIQSVQPQVEAFQKLESSNRTLVDQNKALMAQLELALSNVQRLEKNRTVQQGVINKLETQARTLEVTVSALGNFINNLIEDKVNIEIPGEIRRVVAQIPCNERRKSDAKNTNNIFNMFKKTERVVNPNKLMVKSFSTGKISLNNNNDKKLFSTNHQDILEQVQNVNKIDIKVSDVDMVDDLNRRNSLVSPTSSIDSGVGTPINASEGHQFDDSVNNNKRDPLSNCDISCTYNTRELKKVQCSARDMSRNASPVL